MRIIDVLHKTHRDAGVVLTECSQFIEESDGNVLFRALPSSYEDVHKVKVRKKKSGYVDIAFNEAFDEQYPDLRQRAIFASGQLDVIYENTEPFLIFPIDGYKFMYNTTVLDSKTEHQKVFDNLQQMLNSNQSIELVADMLKFTYTHTNLAEGISSGAEIVLYNIPYYYAVRASSTHLEIPLSSTHTMQ